MKIIRLSWRNPPGDEFDGDEHKGFTFHGTAKSARDKRSKRVERNGELCTWEEFEVRCTAFGLVHALNRFAGHNDNG